MGANIGGCVSKRCAEEESSGRGEGWKKIGGQGGRGKKLRIRTKALLAWGRSLGGQAAVDLAASTSSGSKAAGKLGGTLWLYCSEQCRGWSTRQREKHPTRQGQQASSMCSVNEKLGTKQRLLRAINTGQPPTACEFRDGTD